ISTNRDSPNIFIIIKKVLSKVRQIILPILNTFYKGMLLLGRLTIAIISSNKNYIKALYFLAIASIRLRYDILYIIYTFIAIVVIKIYLLNLIVYLLIY
ncbi:hypothetical protein BBK36DRAFT_1117108, partial [Trichoderma citrinoviride]